MQYHHFIKVALVITLAFFASVVTHAEAFSEPNMTIRIMNARNERMADQAVSVYKYGPIKNGSVFSRMGGPLVTNAEGEVSMNLPHEYTIVGTSQTTTKYLVRMSPYAPILREISPPSVGGPVRWYTEIDHSDRPDLGTQVYEIIIN